MSTNNNKTIKGYIITIKVTESVVVKIYWTHRDGFEPVTFQENHHF